jgi:hypothetical protein
MKQYLPERLFLTDNEVAKYFGVSVASCRRWRLKGIGPKWRRVGEGSIRYAIADVEAYANSLPSGGAQEAA